MSTLTQAAFARHLNVRPSYVKKLKDTGRLVMVSDTLIDVEASEARIRETADPGKVAVAERHAAKRAGQAAAATETKAATMETKAGPRVDGHKTAKTAADPGEPEAPEVPGTPDYQKARARKESANADLAEMEARTRAGQLMETAAVMAAVADAGATMRTHLATLSAILAPQLATMADENQIRLLLEDHIEQALGELVERLDAAGRGAE